MPVAGELHAKVRTSRQRCGVLLPMMRANTAGMPPAMGPDRRRMWVPAKRCSVRAGKPRGHM